MTNEFYEYILHGNVMKYISSRHKSSYKNEKGIYMQ